MSPLSSQPSGKVWLTCPSRSTRKWEVVCPFRVFSPLAVSSDLGKANVPRSSSRPGAQTAGSACHSATAEAKAVPRRTQKRTSPSIPRACPMASPRWKLRALSSQPFRICIPSTSGQSTRRNGHEPKRAGDVGHKFDVAASQYTYAGTMSIFGVPRSESLSDTKALQRRAVFEVMDQMYSVVVR